ncbi:MAG: hypothetical protein E7294_07350 [Lachnospiraceae bacterium]|nr:hypothetical protein [Lachnospiraceae bacterium]
MKNEEVEYIRLDESDVEIVCDPEIIEEEERAAEAIEYEEDAGWDLEEMEAEDPFIAAGVENGAEMGEMLGGIPGMIVGAFLGGAVGTIESILNDF